MKCIICNEETIWELEWVEKNSHGDIIDNVEINEDEEAAAVFNRCCYTCELEWNTFTGVTSTTSHKDKRQGRGTPLNTVAVFLGRLKKDIESIYSFRSQELKGRYIRRASRSAHALAGAISQSDNSSNVAKEYVVESAQWLRHLLREEHTEKWEIDALLDSISGFLVRYKYIEKGDL